MEGFTIIDMIRIIVICIMCFSCGLKIDATENTRKVSGSVWVASTVILWLFIIFS